MKLFELSHPKFWYKKTFLSYFFLPITWLYLIIIKIRKYIYCNLLKPKIFPVPIIVVGNLTVGGTGKTPLVIWIANFLKAHGYKPGVISRGYKGKAKNYPCFITEHSNVIEAGDEAIIIARRTNCPVVVDPKRYRAAKMLLEKTNCNVILSDDGLQHYALPRDIEIVVIDGDELFGNKFCFPAGPLREPISRLQSVNFIVQNAGTNVCDAYYAMHLKQISFINVLDSSQKKAIFGFSNQKINVVAGIGNPQRFFKDLEVLGIEVLAHVFSDHYWYTKKDFSFISDPVIMTEKDAVKCVAIANENFWYLLVAAEVKGDFSEQLLAALLRCSHKVC
jgi:tetraacyldisaccharide 4'-kinase